MLGEIDGYWRNVTNCPTYSLHAKETMATNSSKTAITVLVVSFNTDCIKCNQTFLGYKEKSMFTN